MHLFYILLNFIFGNHLLIGSLHSGEFLQEGFGRLWRGTNASLALAVPTVSSLKKGCSCLSLWFVKSCSRCFIVLQANLHR